MLKTFDIEHNRLFSELKATLQEDIVKIAGKCNGGKSILFVYPPRDEEAYIAKAHEVLTDGFGFIDVRETFGRRGNSPWIAPAPLTKYLSTTEHEERQVTDSMHLCPQPLYL